MYLVAPNLLVNNQLNSLSNSSLRQIIDSLESVISFTIWTVVVAIKAKKEILLEVNFFQRPDKEFLETMLKMELIMMVSKSKVLFNSIFGLAQKICTNKKRCGTFRRTRH